MKIPESVREGMPLSVMGILQLPEDLRLLISNVDKYLSEIVTHRKKCPEEIIDPLTGDVTRDTGTPIEFLSLDTAYNHNYDLYLMFVGVISGGMLEDPKGWLEECVGYYSLVSDIYARYYNPNSRRYRRINMRSIPSLPLPRTVPASYRSLPFICKKGMLRLLALCLAKSTRCEFLSLFSIAGWLEVHEFNLMISEGYSFKPINGVQACDEVLRIIGEGNLGIPVVGMPSKIDNTVKPPKPSRKCPNSQGARSSRVARNAIPQTSHPRKFATTAAE